MHITKKSFDYNRINDVIHIHSKSKVRKDMLLVFDMQRSLMWMMCVFYIYIMHYNKGVCMMHILIMFEHAACNYLTSYGLLQVMVTNINKRQTQQGFFFNSSCFVEKQL